MFKGFRHSAPCPGFESLFAHRRSPQCAYHQFESPQAHVGAQGSQGGLQGFETSQVHRMVPRSPNFRDDTPQTNNHSQDHAHGWAKPSSGPPSWSLSSSQSGCSIVMGTCHQCAATGLPGERFTTCGAVYQAKRGTHPAGGATSFPRHPQYRTHHQVLAGPPAPSARVELPCAPPSMRNAPHSQGNPNPPLPQLSNTVHRVSTLCRIDHGSRRRWRFFELPFNTKSSSHWSPTG